MCHLFTGSSPPEVVCAKRQGEPYAWKRVAFLDVNPNVGRRKKTAKDRKAENKQNAKEDKERKARGVADGAREFSAASKFLLLI